MNRVTILRRGLRKNDETKLSFLANRKGDIHCTIGIIFLILLVVKKSEYNGGQEAKACFLQ